MYGARRHNVQEEEVKKHNLPRGAGLGGITYGNNKVDNEGEGSGNI